MKPKGNISYLFDEAKQLSGLGNDSSLVVNYHRVLKPDMCVSTLEFGQANTYVSVVDSDSQNWTKSVAILYNNSIERSRIRLNLPTSNSTINTGVPAEYAYPDEEFWD